jgi:hypothetical protein
MPPLEKGYIISVRPGEQLEFSRCSFSGIREKEVRLYHVRDSRRVVQVVSTDNKLPAVGTPLPWLSLRNDTPLTEIYLLVFRNKVNEGPWQTRNFEVLKAGLDPQGQIGVAARDFIPVQEDELDKFDRPPPLHRFDFLPDFPRTLPIQDEAVAYFRISNSPPFWDSAEKALWGLKVTSLPTYATPPSEEDLKSKGIGATPPTGFESIGIETLPMGPGGPHSLMFAVVPQTSQDPASDPAIRKVTGSDAIISKVDWSAMRYILCRLNSVVRLNEAKLADSLIVLTTQNLGLADLVHDADGTHVPIDTSKREGSDSKTRAVLLNTAALVYDMGAAIGAEGLGGASLSFFVPLPIRVGMLVMALACDDYALYDAVKQYLEQVKAVNDSMLAQRAAEQRAAEQRAAQHPAEQQPGRFIHNVEPHIEPHVAKGPEPKAPEPKAPEPKGPEPKGPGPVPAPPMR